MIYNDITLIFKFLGSHYGILFPVSPYFPQFFAIFSSESSSSLYHSKRSMSSALLYLLSVLVSSCQEFISTQLNIPFQNLSSPFSSETFVVDFSIGHKLPIFWNLCSLQYYFFIWGSILSCCISFKDSSIRTTEYKRESFTSFSII